jgi:hypothetical protein
MLTFLGAMMLAVVLEAGCVYWIWTHPEHWTHADPSSDLVVSWTGPGLVQGGLVGALLMLSYQFCPIVMRPRAWDEQRVRSNRRAFLRTWRWMMALMAVQGMSLYVDQLGAK